MININSRGKSFWDDSERKEKQFMIVREEQKYKVIRFKIIKMLNSLKIPFEEYRESIIVHNKYAV